MAPRARMIPTIRGKHYKFKCELAKSLDQFLSSKKWYYTPKKRLLSLMMPPRAYGEWGHTIKRMDTIVDLILHNNTKENKRICISDSMHIIIIDEYGTSIVTHISDPECFEKTYKLLREKIR